ncbi:MAG: DUF3592 domain-containing protein [Bacteroidetes bacterium]|nr:DUF3592 domain-containing protein [Bacteroidota bacterium]
MDIIRLIKLLFTFMFVCAGTMFIVISVREGLKPYRLLKYGLETEGTVVEMYKRPMKVNEKSSGSYAPVVKFMTEKGEIVTYYSTTFTNFNDFTVGQKVRVFYDSNNPQTATLEGKDGWILAVVFGIFGFFMCLIFYTLFIQQVIGWWRERKG